MGVVINKYKVGLQISEAEYRKIPIPSYSFISNLEKVEGDMNMLDPSNNEDISDLPGIIFGKLVDNLLLDQIEPDNLKVVKKKPSGKALIILKILKEHSDQLPNPNIFLKSNKNIIVKVCDAVGYYNSKTSDNYERRIKGLKNYREYYKAYEPTSFIIDNFSYNVALKAVNNLKQSPLFSLDHIEIIPQIKLTGIYNGVKYKIMMDMVVIDHFNKTITPYDLKTGAGKVDDFIESAFLNWNYYIQAELYSIIFMQNIDDVMKALNLDINEYSIETFKFLYYSKFENNYDIYDSNFKVENNDVTKPVTSNYLNNDITLSLDQSLNYKFSIDNFIDNTTITINKLSLFNLNENLKSHLVNDIKHLYYNALT